MAENDQGTEKKSEMLSSKNESENDGVEVTEFNIRVRCTRNDITKSCQIQDIEAIAVPSKDQPVETPAVSTNAAAPVTPANAEPATLVAAASRQLSEVEAKECDLCQILADALREQAKAAASRRMPSWVGRRKIAKS